MYTGCEVSRLLRPLSICIVLVLGILPGAALACQWACAGGDDPAAGHSAHHQHHSTAPQHPTSGLTSIVATQDFCDHLGTAVTGVTTATLKVVAPVAMVAMSQPYGESMVRAAVVASVASHSPPGARSAPLPLRI